MRHVFLWEEDERDRDVLIALLEDEYLVRAVGGTDGAKDALRDGSWDLIILGIAECTGDKTQQALRFLQVLAPATPILCRLPHGDPALFTTLLRQGVAACISRDCSRDELKSWLRKVRVPLEIDSACRETPGPCFRAAPEDSLLLGNSACMRRVRSRIGLFARYDFPVLITGESGTGKELAARSIHRLSRRACRPFLAVNCGAIPETILESELFGTEKGAYTGAVTRPGTFEAADGGTLFLDEITELSPGAQAKLLRVLENGEIRRLGARASATCDVRLISATNVDLERHRGLRFDLLERIETLVLKLPPLRERPEDIPLLARHFLADFESETAIGDDAMELLAGYDWPGNVRQLRNTIRRSAVAAAETDAGSGIIRADHVDFGSRPAVDRQARAE